MKKKTSTLVTVYDNGNTVVTAIVPDSFCVSWSDGKPGIRYQSPINNALVWRPLTHIVHAYEEV